MKRNTKILIAAVMCLALSMLASLCVGASAVPLKTLLGAIRDGGRETAQARIFYYVRLPRMLAAVMAGGALSVSGLLLQSVLNNPLAAPGVIGVNSGAGLAALIAMCFLPGASLAVPSAAFAGACIAAFGVYLLARLTGASRSTVALAGVAVSSLLGAAMDGIVTVFPEAAMNRSAFSIGGFANVGMDRLGFALPFCAAGILIPLVFARELEIMSLGDDVARSLGVRVEAFRAMFILAAAMLAGSAVSFAGLIGFVGLIGPHTAKIIMKNDRRLQIPICAALGSCLCLICDLIARTAFAPYELPVGIVMSAVGAPFFLWLLLTRKRQNRHSGG